MWPPSRTFFGLLLFLASASQLQAQGAEKASGDEGANVLGLDTPSLGQAIVDKFMTSRSSGEVIKSQEKERTGREVELITTSTISPQNSPSPKEGPIIPDVSLEYKNIPITGFNENHPQQENLMMPRYLQHQPATGQSACPPAPRWFLTGG